MSGVVTPTRPPSEVVAALDKYYLSTVTTSGGVAGATAVAPLGVSVPVAVLDLAAFTEASALYALALAEIHGVGVQDLERRRTLVLAVLLGSSGSRVVEKAAGRTAPYWGRALTRRIPMSTIGHINKVLGRNFVTKYGTKQGILVLGKQAPLGIGAGIGAAGNATFGYGVIRAARRAFGPPPAEWPSVTPGGPPCPQ